MISFSSIVETANFWTTATQTVFTVYSIAVFVFTSVLLPGMLESLVWRELTTLLRTYFMITFAFVPNSLYWWKRKDIRHCALEMYFLFLFAVPKVCGSKRDDCHTKLATCRDIDGGSYDCICKTGYVGNGKTCFG